MSSSTRQSGQSTINWLIAVAFVAVAAAGGFALFGQGSADQGARLADALAGHNAAVQTAAADAPARPATPIADYQSHGSAVAYAQGLVNGIYQAVLDDLSVFLTPLETLAALYALAEMLVEDVVGTAQKIVDELLLEPLDTLVNGSAYDRGFVVGSQITPTKAVSVVSKLAVVGAVVAPAKRLSKQVVIGQFKPTSPKDLPYHDLADKLGARYFDIPKKAWDKMTHDQRVAANKLFLDRAIARGDEIILATPYFNAPKGSFFHMEVQHLVDRGYRFSKDGRRAIPP